MTPYGYSRAVWAHFDNPGNIGPWTDPERDVFTGEADTPAGPARLRLQCRVNDGLVREARFQAYGGVEVIAAGSWLCEWLYNRPVSQARDLDMEAMVERLGLAAVQRYSAVMAVDALRAALRYYESSESNEVAK
jgi:NifU-like protein involved in Fe-S cluster formation